MDVERDRNQEAQKTVAGVDPAIEAVATAENAREYAKADEKFLFCIDILGVSAHHDDAERWVNQLEDRFDALNEQRDIIHPTSGRGVR